MGHMFRSDRQNWQNSNGRIDETSNERNALSYVVQILRICSFLGYLNEYNILFKVLY